MATTLAATPTIRTASRQLVREWGFLRPTLANTTLSHAAVHCLYEIGENDVRTAPALRAALAVGEPELARALGELMVAGDIAILTDDADDDDAVHVAGEEGDEDKAVFSVTANGRDILRAVNNFAAEQVQGALAAYTPTAVETIMGGLQLYATALQALRMQQQPQQGRRAGQTAAAAIAPPAPATDAKPGPPPPQGRPVVEIVPGYRPGILARTLEMHTRFYCRPPFGWGRSFEAELASGLGDLLSRLDRPVNQAWTAVQTIPPPSHGQEGEGGEERIVGTIFIDGEDLGQPGKVAHLRAFIVDDGVRGSGAGRRLLGAAMEFVRRIGFDEVHLYTIRSLVPAVRLYTEAGFREVSETDKFEFGVRTRVLHLVWRKGEAEEGKGELVFQITAAAAV